MSGASERGKCGKRKAKPICTHDTEGAENEKLFLILSHGETADTISSARVNRLVTAAATANTVHSWRVAHAVCRTFVTF